MLECGQISKGKRQQMMKALIVPSDNTRSWTVPDGETITMELGAPFDFSFKYDQDEETISVDGKSIFITGAAGESYQRLWNCVPTPELISRKKGTKRGKELQKLRHAGSQQELDQGWEWAWYPFNATIEKSKKGEIVELQLFEKKNKLFGKIESEWR